MIKVDRLPVDPGPAAWNEILPPAPDYPWLEGDLNADFLVIGAGFAGLSAARRLKQLQPDAEIVLLEARRIGEGSQGRNSGFMIDLPHNLSSSDYAGQMEKDREQTAMNRAAIEFAREAARDYQMPEEAFVQCGKINGAATTKGARHNLDYAAHLDKLGEPYRLFDETEIERVTGSSYYQSGLYTPGTAMLQPALYVRAFASGLANEDVRVFEGSPVTALTQEGALWCAEAAMGRVRAGRVILCVNGHAESFGFFKRQLMHIFLYASMTRPLSPDEVTELGGVQRWGITPSDPLGTTVRRISGTGGDRIVIRNRISWAPSRKISCAAVTRAGETHDHAFHARFPMLDEVTMEHRWGGLLCLSRNATPAFGEVAPRLFSACCQNGLGTAIGTLSGKLAAEYAVGHRSEMLDQMLALPAPKRLPVEPFATIGARSLLSWGEFQAGREL